MTVPSSRTRPLLSSSLLLSSHSLQSAPALASRAAHHRSNSVPVVATIMEDADEDHHRPELRTFDSSETTSSTENEGYAPGHDSSAYSDGEGVSAQHFPTSSTVDEGSYDQVTPLTSYSTYAWSASATQNGHPHTSRPPETMASTPAANYEPVPVAAPSNGVLHPQQQQQQRISRPGNLRQPSNAYAPARRPHQYSLNGATRPLNTATHRPKRNPDAEYRAQEKAYVQRIRQDIPDEELFAPPTPSLDYSSATESEESSPTGTNYADQDQTEMDTLLYYGNEDIEPSVEELKVPANRERLEWHAMLANVLTGDVVKQEKKRLIGGGVSPGDSTLRNELWLGIRARICGRTIPQQKRALEEGRSEVASIVEEVCSFAIKGEAEVHKPPIDQVREVVRKMEKVESLYPSLTELENGQPRAASQSYKDTCDAVISWFNTTQLINTQLMVLQKWVGNTELDFTKPRERPEGEEHSHLFDETSFIDRVLKEDGLKSFSKEGGLLERLNLLIHKAKATLIANAESFAIRHLPPYIEELLTLINFPSRLIQEIIRLRLAYARRMKDPGHKNNVTAGAMTAEQMILQFQLLLQLAVKIKLLYTEIAKPEPGWDLPPCIDENFDSVVVHALQFYFKLVDMKLSANKNTLKEAEILEGEWDFSSKLGRQLDGGDLEVAYRFSEMTHHSMARLATNFEKELQTPLDARSSTSDFEKRVRAVLDSVRVRQRKIFRFGRILSQRFENSTEYMINIEIEQFEDLLHSLKMSGHVLVSTSNGTDNDAASGTTKKGESKVYIIASPALRDRLQDIQTMLGTCYHAEDTPEDPSNPYILIMYPEHSVRWQGPRTEAPLGPSGMAILREPWHSLGLKQGAMRLVADGSQQRLTSANAAFQAAISVDLKVRVEQRANLARVKKELDKIRKTAHKLSSTIMDSVAIVRSQTEAAGRKSVSQELIQTCFAFATEFGQRSAIHMDAQMRDINQHNLTKLALDWVSFICDDCVASDRKTFRWAVVALEFAMIMTRGQNILSISDDEYARLRVKVAGCMSLLISHFDIMGARSIVAAQAERQRNDANGSTSEQGRLRTDEESIERIRRQWVGQLERIDQLRTELEAEQQGVGRVLEDSNEADRALTYLSATHGNVHLSWQQGQFVGGGTFGSVYVAVNLDSNQLMAVKEIRLQDPKLIPTVISQIRDEVTVLQGLHHPNIVNYYGIEPHRDKVYIFMEYCARGSLAANLEHGRIEDEFIIQVYAFQLLEGLAYLHEAGVVHRDIKPENILLDHMGVIKYVDFGAAKVIAKQGKTVVADRLDRRGEQAGMAGTPMYMAPEAIAPNDYPHTRMGSVDIWSLGCVISEMATALRPWSNLDNEFAIMYTIAHGPGTPTLPTKDQLSPLGIDFLKKCFDRDPARRASAAELLQHEWFVNIRTRLDLRSDTPATPASENGSSFTGSQSAIHTPASSLSSFM